MSHRFALAEFIAAGRPDDAQEDLAGQVVRRASVARQAEHEPADGGRVALEHAERERVGRLG
jgi:hypothetical protein